MAQESNDVTEIKYIFIICLSPNWQIGQSNILSSQTHSNHSKKVTSVGTRELYSQIPLSHQKRKFSTWIQRQMPLRNRSIPHLGCCSTYLYKGQAIGHRIVVLNPLIGIQFPFLVTCSDAPLSYLLGLTPLHTFQFKISFCLKPHHILHESLSYFKFPCFLEKYQIRLPCAHIGTHQFNQNILLTIFCEMHR